jgi:hypothetical protein
VEQDMGELVVLSGRRGALEFRHEMLLAACGPYRTARSDDPAPGSMWEVGPMPGASGAAADAPAVFVVVICLLERRDRVGTRDQRAQVVFRRLLSGRPDPDCAPEALHLSLWRLTARRVEDVIADDCAAREGQ